MNNLNFAITLILADLFNQRNAMELPFGFIRKIKNLYSLLLSLSSFRKYLSNFLCVGSVVYDKQRRQKNLQADEKEREAKKKRKEIKETRLSLCVYLCRDEVTLQQHRQWLLVLMRSISSCSVPPFRMANIDDTWMPASRPASLSLWACNEMQDKLATILRGHQLLDKK